MKNNIKIKEPFVVKNRYYNNKQDYLKSRGFLRPIKNLFFTIFKEVFVFLFSTKQRFFDFFKDNSYWVKNSSIVPKRYDPVITWIGHSTFLIQMGNFNILTDPVFENINIFYRRIFKPGVTFEKLPALDFILISHNHFDHLSSQTMNEIKQFYPYVKILVPVGSKRWFMDMGFTRVVEFNWWQDQDLLLPDSNIKFTFLPAYHWSGRKIFDKNKSLWGSWMIESAGYKVYFGGDTAYWDHFKDIGNHFSHIDIALLPIGPCLPRAFMKNSHMNAKESGQALIDLNAKYMVPMHWGTFYLGGDRFDTPVNELIYWWEDNSQLLGNKKLMLLGIGEQIKTEKQAYIETGGMIERMKE